VLSGSASAPKDTPDGEFIKLADERALFLEAAELLPDRGDKLRATRSPEWMARVEQLPSRPVRPFLEPAGAEELFGEAHDKIRAKLLRRGDAERLAELDQIYDEIHARYSRDDAELVRRRTVPTALDSRILLIAQALGRCGRRGVEAISPKRFVGDFLRPPTDARTRRSV